MGKGRTNPTQRDAFDGVADELDRLARGLRRRYQAMLDAMGYRNALHMANPTDPWITVLVCVCLAQQWTLVDAGLASADPVDVSHGTLRNKTDVTCGGVNAIGTTTEKLIIARVHNPIVEFNTQPSK